MLIYFILFIFTTHYHSNVF